MDFARKHLEKYGWTAGKGLGKYENGISEALKPKLKRSVTGVGHDLAADFTEHWWNDLYNKAAQNLEVEEKNGKIRKIKCKNPSGFEITNNTWHIKKKKEGTNSEQQYSDYFVKTAILSNDGSKVENVKGYESENEELRKDIFKITDEELFAACEGRTAHKGARHGLKALGKLARIEQQEKILLKQPKYIGYSHRNVNIKDSLNKNDSQVVENNYFEDDVDIAVIKNKKKKKKHCSIENRIVVKNAAINIEEVTKCLSGNTELITDKPNEKETVGLHHVDEDSKIVLKKKRSNIKSNISLVDDRNDIDVECDTPKKKKKKVTENIVNTVSDMDVGNTPTDDHSLGSKSIKKHKKKRKRDQ